MGCKGKRVHEQSAGSSTPAGDYETIRLISAQKQDATGTGSSLPTRIPPGLDPPESRAVLLDHQLDQIRVPSVRSVNTVPCPAVDVIPRMYYSTSMQTAC